MSENKRGRGRPEGDGKNDDATLRAMADLIAADPALKPTRAIRQVLGRPDETTIRRVHRKWRARSKIFLDMVRKRETQQPRHRGVDIATLGTLSSEVHRAMQAQGLAIKTVTDYFDSPGMRAARGIMNDPSIRAMRDIMNDPALVAARAMMNEPSMILAREHAKLSAVRIEQERMMLGSYLDPTLERLRKGGWI